MKHLKMLLPEGVEGQNHPSVVLCLLSLRIQAQPVGLVFDTPWKQQLSTILRLTNEELKFGKGIRLMGIKGCYLMPFNSTSLQSTGLEKQMREANTPEGAACSCQLLLPSPGRDKGHSLTCSGTSQQWLGHY